MDWALPSGLTQYRNNRFRTYTTTDGLPDKAVTQPLLRPTRACSGWWPGVSLCRFQDGKFTVYAPGPGLTVTSVRAMREDNDHNLIVAGFGGVMMLSGGKATTLVDEATLSGDLVTSLVVRPVTATSGSAETLGLILRTPAGKIRKFDERDGLPNLYVRAVLEDRDGNLWLGTNGGLARLQGDRFVAASPGSRLRDLVRVLQEDNEGNLWMGAYNGLTRVARRRLHRVWQARRPSPAMNPTAFFRTAPEISGSVSMKAA